MDVDRDGLGDLVSRAEQLATELDAGADLPRVQRNLPQILEACERLWARNTQLSHDATDTYTKASMLLGPKGYDLPKISQTLESLNAMKSFEPLEPLHDTDIQGFLKNERENALLAIIEQSRKNTIEDLHERQWNNLETEWNDHKQSILSALVGSNQQFLPFVQEMTVLEDTVNLKGRSSLDNIEMAYAKQVYEYNQEIIAGGIPTSLVTRFQSVAKELNDKNVIALWDQVMFMTDVPTTTVSGTPSRLATETNQAFISQAIRYLEHSYKQYITATVFDNLQKAQLGGVPGTIQLIRSFLNVKQLQSFVLEDGDVEGQPVWPMIYYCLRCGDVAAANTLVNKVSHKVGEFASFLQDYTNSSDRRLTSANETKIRLQYRRVIHNSRDPFKRAVYCVVGQCDSSDTHAEIADKIDDYLWIKLKHTTVNVSEPPSDLIPLSQLQHLLYVDFGESHFSAYQQPYLYVQVLLLTAQFEAAIEFLSRLDKLRSHAVHISLALQQLKFLNETSVIESQLFCKDSRSESSLYKINLARLVMLYTRKFEATDTRDALQYFYCLRKMTTREGTNLFMSCISELVQETREFDMLLGRLSKDGTRQPGAIDKFKTDTKQIIEVVAKDTESKGLLEDAVKLYDLAKKPDKVLELLNVLLAQVALENGVNQSNRDRIRGLSVNVAERYRTESSIVNQSTCTTFYLLLDLLTFIDLYHAGSFDRALEVMEELKLLPFSTDVVDKKVTEFRNYTDEVRRLLPDILLATMNCLLSLYKNSRSGVSGSLSQRYPRAADGGKEIFCNSLRSQAKALIVFAGTLPYRMPGDANARLVQMEVLMN